MRCSLCGKTAKQSRYGAGKQLLRITCCGFGANSHTLYGTDTELEPDDSVLDRYELMQSMFSAASLVQVESDSTDTTAHD